jgi:hypothetical protein
MKTAVFALSIVLAGSLAAFAGNCPTTTYNQYLGAGFTCQINDNTFSDFSYLGDSNPPGSGIPASSVQVIPITTMGNPGFQFSAPWSVSTASGLMSQESFFNDVVNVNQCGGAITDLVLSIAGATFQGTRSITVDEAACLGAILPSCTGGTIIRLSVFDSASGQQLVDTDSFAPTTEISVSKDVFLYTGTDGSASLASVTDQYAESAPTVPEPGTLSMLGAGALALAGFSRRGLKL